MQREGGSPEVTRIVEQVHKNLDAIERGAPDTKGRRERIATAMMAAHVASPNTLARPDGTPLKARTAGMLALVSIEYADALIAELDK